MFHHAQRMGLPSFCILAGIASFLFSQSQIQVGYTLLTADPGTSVPVGTALFSVTNSQGVLVSQAGAAAADPILSGRIFVDQDGAETALALVNPSQQKASITLVLRDSSGTEVARQNLSLDSSNHIAKFVSQLFPNLAAGFAGTLTFESSQKLATITLRLTKNTQNEDLYTTLPVIDLSAPPSSDPIVFPHIAAGAGYSLPGLLSRGCKRTRTRDPRRTVPVCGKDQFRAILTSCGAPINANSEICRLVSRGLSRSGPAFNPAIQNEPRLEGGGSSVLLM